MAVINIRVSDDTRDALRERADHAGTTLSEFVRNLVLQEVAPVHAPQAPPGDMSPPDSMRLIDRQVLSMLHRVLARVLPEDANDVDGDSAYQLMRAEILEQGYTAEYWYETAGFRSELTKLDCSRVLDILKMFRHITFSVGGSADVDPVSPELAAALEFRGFDHNDARESHMADYIDHLTREDRWQELKPQIARHDDGNSHTPMLSTYLRMVAAYREILKSRERGFGSSDRLTADELRRIANARTHPSRLEGPGA